MMEATAKAIFITNTFAGAYPKTHVELWAQFEKEVPVGQRSGAYGADNLAYVRWLKKQTHPLIRHFLQNDIQQMRL